MTEEEVSYEGLPWHAHCGTRSRDCDGSHETGFDYRQSTKDGEGLQFEWDDNLELLDILVSYAFYLPDVDCSTVTVRQHEQGLGYIIESHRETEEGFDSMGITMCQSSWCEIPAVETQRDHTAESMGY